MSKVSSSHAKRTYGLLAGALLATVLGVQSFTQYSAQLGPESIPNLYVTQSTTDVPSRQLLGGFSADSVLQLNFAVDGAQSVEVTNITLWSRYHDFKTLYADVQRLELFRVGDANPFALATVGNCSGAPIAAMCVRMSQGELVVPGGSSVEVLVRPRLNSDVDGAVSGHRYAFGIIKQSTNPVQARIAGTRTKLQANNGNEIAEGEVFVGTSVPARNADVIGDVNTVVLSKLSSLTNADPNANGTAISTGLARDIGQFKFSTAAANNTKNGTNKWTLSTIIFNVNATNVLLGSGDQTSLATSDFYIWNKANVFVSSRCTANLPVATGNNLIVTCSNIQSDGVITEIHPNTDLTFVLRADVVNAKIVSSMPSTLQVSIQNFNDPTLSQFSAAGSHLQWLDRDITVSKNYFWAEYAEPIIYGTRYEN